MPNRNPDFHGRAGRPAFPSSHFWILLGLLCIFQQSLGAQMPGVFAGKLEAGREVLIKLDFSRTGFLREAASGKIYLVEATESIVDKWTLTVLSGPGQPIGTLHAAADAQQFSGTWQARDAVRATPVLLNRLEDKSPLLMTEEVNRASEDFVQRAVRAALASEFGLALHYLRLYRVTNELAFDTRNWEPIFDAKASDTEEELYDYKDPSDSGFKFAYRLAERSPGAEARRIYRTWCRTDPSDRYLPGGQGDIFTCLMYAALSEEAADRTGMLEGYDRACVKLAFACPKAFGPGEERLIDAIASNQPSAALELLKQPGLNVNAKAGKALTEAVTRRQNDLVEALLNYGADPNVTPEIVQLATESKDQGMLKILNDHGADPPPREIQPWRCPDDVELEVEPASKYALQGAMGQQQVRVFLERGGDAVVGVFYTLADWDPLILRGRWLGDGAIEVAGGTAKLKGTVSATGFTGDWTPNEAAGQAVRLHPAPALSCDGKGPWTRFNNPSFPFSFSYPASWHVLRDPDRGLIVVCPDPESMLYQHYYISITDGSTTADPSLSGLPRAGEFFFRAVDTWYSDKNCAPEDLSDCHKPEVTHRGQATILTSEEGEWRVYCNGGDYRGQGYGKFGSVVIGKYWMQAVGQQDPSEIVARILSTARLRP